MSSTIPPLVCNTPPPIDSDQDDDDLGSEGIDSTFTPSEDDTSLPPTPKHTKINQKRETSCVRPLETIESQDDAVPIEPPADDVCLTDNESPGDANVEQEITADELSQANPIGADCTKVDECREAGNEIQISSNSVRVMVESPPPDDDYDDRNESPPSLELATGKYSDIECDINENELNDECDDFQGNSNEPSADNISLPSLKFDSIRNSPVPKSEEIDEKKSEPDNVDDTPIESIADTTLPNVDEPSEARLSESVCSIEATDSAVVPENDDAPSGDFAFDADFSQFATFGNETGISMPSEESIEEQPCEESSRSPDFGDFEEGSMQRDFDSGGGGDDDDDDDDFGDFNDFQQETAVPPSFAEIPRSTSFDLKSISEKFKSILDTAFPPNDGDEGYEEDISNEHTVPSRSTEQIFINATTRQLKNFENAKAMQHQWADSTGKNALIKALGIDARNIMYGEHWKSPLPRFASNLGYNALEPLKPMTVDKSQPIAMHSQLSDAVTASGSDSGIKLERMPEVPAAQFDWNSAGLVNPLDASHAHTLLLDLEQLAVMENLDKITHDCSSSSYSSSTCNININNHNDYINVTPSTASAFASITSSTNPPNNNTNNANNNNNNNNNPTKLRSIFGSVKSSAASIIDSTLPKIPKTGLNIDGFINQTTTSIGRTTSNAFNGLLMNHVKSTQNHNVLLVAENAYQMDQPYDPYYFDSAQEVVHEANIAENQLSRIDADPKKSIEGDSPSGKCSASEIVLSATASLPKPTKIPTTSLTEQIAVDEFNVNSIDMAASLATFEPTPQSSSYSVPGSSGTLKETHIFTPNKTNITSSHVPSLATVAADVAEPVPAPKVLTEFDFERARAGVIIDENVVKKEYHDIEYDPSKLTPTACAEGDDFSEFQSGEVRSSATPNALNSILQPVKSATNVAIDWPDPGNVVDTNAIDEFRNYVSNSTSSGKRKHSSHNGFAFSQPTIGTSPSEDMFAQSNNVAKCDDSDFSEFQSTTTPGISYISHISAIPDIIPATQTFVNAKPSPIPPTNATVDDCSVSLEHSTSIAKHIAPPAIAPAAPTVPSFASSLILVPQITAQPTQTFAPNQSSIAWPEPGISADEMARLEAIFPQAKKSANGPPPMHNVSSNSSGMKATNSRTEDDEWSDFVSVAQPQTPITNILNQNLQKHQGNDDDDWSDFISSAVPPPSLPTMPSQFINSGPNFTSWNAPSQYSSWSHSTPSPMTFTQTDSSVMSSPQRSVGNGINHNSLLTNGHGHGHAHAQASVPSIISMPNLGFAAPKTLVNMPKPNVTKK